METAPGNRNRIPTKMLGLAVVLGTHQFLEKQGVFLSRKLKMNFKETWIEQPLVFPASHREEHWLSMESFSFYRSTVWDPTLCKKPSSWLFLFEISQGLRKKLHSFIFYQYTGNQGQICTVQEAFSHRAKDKGKKCQYSKEIGKGPEKETNLRTCKCIIAMF